MRTVLPIAAGLLSIGALIYLYVRHRDKKDKNKDGGKRAPEIEPIETLEFQVDNQQVPQVIGRNSVILKSIEEKTATIIRFRENGENHQICSIRGKISAVKIAKQLVDIEAAKPVVITDEILVPTSSCGKIEGYCGSVLHEICQKSSAKVWVDPGTRKVQGDTRRVLITGTKEQVELAKKLIEEKIKEVNPEEQQSNDDKQEIKREPRGTSPSQYASNSSITTTDSPRELLFPSPEKLRNSEGQLEVFVSAVSSPSRFWVQLVGPQSTELDFLVDAMTEYYNNKEHRELHQIREPYLGQIVAAMLYNDNKWYRAEIVAIQPNESSPDELVLDVYFLDYGDSQFVSKKDVLELRADFLSLRFQAVECFLAHVQPANGGSKLDEWDERSVDKFEELVQVAQWKKLASKVVTYKERKSFALQRKSKKRESSPIPGVELYDSDNADLNIALELVRLGHAEISDHFGDLNKSVILTPTDGGTLKGEKDSPASAKIEPLPVVIQKESTPEPVQITSSPEFINIESSPEIISIESSPEPLRTSSDATSSVPLINNNTIEPVLKLNNEPFSTPRAEPTTIFNGQGKPALSKKNQVADFLKNEQQPQPVKKHFEDWNDMMEDS